MGWGEERDHRLPRGGGGHSRGIGVLQEAELVPLAIGAQGLHDRQDASRCQRCCCVEGLEGGIKKEKGHRGQQVMLRDSR